VVFVFCRGFWLGLGGIEVERRGGGGIGGVMVGGYRGARVGKGRGGVEGGCITEMVVL